MSEPLFVLPASFKTYVVVTQFLAKHGLRQEMYEVVDQALSDWMRAIEASKEKATSSTVNGYQWKHLFLPEGTTLRTVRDGVHRLAHVVGCKVVFDGQCCSPSQFVNEVHGTCRNAWKTIWLLMPNETEWKLANAFRGVQPVIQARKSTPKNKKAALSTNKTKLENEKGWPGGEAASDSLLHMATQLNNIDLMEELLKDGCDANSIGEGGATPIQYAQSEEARSLLLSYGATSG